MEKRYRVALTGEERQQLQAMVTAEMTSARKLARARVLLLADQAEGGPAKSDPQIMADLGCGRATVERVRKKFMEEGLEETLARKPSKRVYERRLDGNAEAHLVAIACSAPPEGRRRWTLRLLGDRLVALGHVDSVAHETVRRTLKRTNLSLGGRRGALPEAP